MGGAAIGIQRALVEGSNAAGLAFLCGSPNKKSLPIVKRVGYHVIGDAHAWVKPLRSAYKLRAYLKHPLLAQLAGPVVDLALRSIDMVRVPPRRTWVGALVDRADDRFDALWDRARERYMILGEKTSTFLNWRYGGFTTERYRMFALSAKDGGALAGFVVFYTRPDGKVFVVDLFAEDLQATLDQLMMGFARAMRREGHTSNLSELRWKRRLRRAPQTSRLFPHHRFEAQLGGLLQKRGAGRACRQPAEARQLANV